MKTELNTLATALYVTTDDLLKASPHLAPWRPAVGIAPQLTDAELAKQDIRLLRPARKGEPERPGAPLFKPLRQVIESVNETFKGQLNLEPRVKCWVSSMTMPSISQATTPSSTPASTWGSATGAACRSFHQASSAVPSCPRSMYRARKQRAGRAWSALHREGAARAWPVGGIDEGVEEVVLHGRAGAQPQQLAGVRQPLVPLSCLGSRGRCNTPSVGSCSGLRDSGGPEAAGAAE
ncbi:hypothetical protein ACH4TV_48265, partial [Streptomyces sp. NPDC020898]